MPYPTYSVEDFCRDPEFIRWVVAPTDESNRFWQSFLMNYPQKASEMHKAAEFVKMFHFKEVEVTEGDLARLKQRILGDINHPVRPLAPVTTLHWYHQKRWIAAAIVLFISALGIGLWTYQAGQGLTYQTDYGKTQEIHLAEGSIITLNANSTLRVASDLANSPKREVWLNGEAYFSIAKRSGARFVVHTPEADVEVLGTEFNVKTRRARTDVVLNEGVVRLSTNSQSATVLKPGDMATILSDSKQISLRKVKPELYDTWKESYLVLDGKSVAEVVDILQDSFGITIQITDSTLAGKQLTGRLQTEVPEDCIANLAVILDVENVRKDDKSYQFK